MAGVAFQGGLGLVGCCGLILAQAQGLVGFYALPLGQAQGLVRFQVFGLRVKSRAGHFSLALFIL